MTTSTSILTSLADLLASQWAGIGLAIDVLSVPAYVVDPEALILATVDLASLDPRLADTSRDWIATYKRYVNHKRLDRMRRAWEPRTWEALDAKPGPGVSRGRVRDIDFDSPATLMLRVRGLTGVNARAEVLLRLAASSSPQTIGALAEWCVYSKQNTAEAVGFLLDAGVARAMRRGNRDEVQLVPENTPAWLRPGKKGAPVIGWAAVLPVVAQAARLTGIDRTLGRVSSQVELRSLMNAAADRLAGTDWPVPDVSPGRDVRAGLDEWQAALVRRLGALTRSPG